MEVTKPSKATKVRVIPNDWEIKTLGTVVDKIMGGGTPLRSNRQYWGKEIPWVTVKDFATFNPYDTQEHITKFGLENSASNLIPKKTLITSTRMGLGKVVIYEVDVSINQDLKALFPSKQVTTEYLFYWFKKNSDVIEKLGNGSTVMGITLNELKSVRFILPPLEEQVAIVSVLSDTDKLISSLEKLISKKRNIKQGAMQKLLNPKKEWTVKRLAEMSEIITKGTTPTSLGKKFVTSGINFIKIESLEKNGVIIKDKLGFIDEETNTLLKRSQLQENDILISIAGALGRVTIVKKEILPANTNQALAIIRLKKDGELDRQFLFYFLNSETIKRHISAINVQAAQANLSLENVGNFRISHPSIDEQKGISRVLFDIDLEITALESKLLKYRQIKSGMMQNLLTGKIRLV